MENSDVAVLRESAESTIILVRRFSSALADQTTHQVSLSENAPDPLHVLYDAAKLLKAHVTKLALLFINRPFTPNAIRKIIAEIVNGCVPAMMGAVGICQLRQYGRCLSSEIICRVRRVLRGFEVMMTEVVSRADKGEFAVTDVLADPSKRANLASVGIIWEACDSLMDLKSGQAAGIIVCKAQGYKDMLEDAIAELREWNENGTDGEAEDQEDLIKDAAAEKLLVGEAKIPKGRHDIKHSLAHATRKLKLMSTLYQALIKRRLKDIPVIGHSDSKIMSSQSIVGRVDAIIDLLQAVPEQADELASAFYDLDVEQASAILNSICEDGKRTISLCRKNWLDELDEFSSWSDKWKIAIDQQADQA